MNQEVVYTISKNIFVGPNAFQNKTKKPNQLYYGTFFFLTLSEHIYILSLKLSDNLCFLQSWQEVRLRPLKKKLIHSYIIKN